MPPFKVRILDWINVDAGTEHTAEYTERVKTGILNAFVTAGVKIALAGYR